MRCLNNYLQSKITFCSKALEDCNNYNKEQLNQIYEIICVLSKSISNDIYAEYKDFFHVFSDLVLRCRDVRMFEQNKEIFTSSLALFAECLQSLLADLECENVNDNEPLVSVILPCYNHEEYVEEAILSVLHQTYKNIELIVSDDASTDGTKAVLKKYEAMFAKILYMEHNTGGTVMGLLPQYTNGKYIAIMHSDDLWVADKIEQQVEYMEQHLECGTCFTWAVYIDENMKEFDCSIFMQQNRSQSEWMQFFWVNGNALCHPSSMTRREYLIDIQKYGASCRQLPDLFKWVEHVQKCPIYIIPEKLTYMRRYNKGEKQNTSVVSKETVIRDNMEKGYVWLRVIRDMPAEFFTSAFSNMFINKNAESEVEIKCEKYFLMLGNPNFFVQSSAFAYFDEIYCECMDCFDKVYNYRKEDFWKDYKERGLYPVIDQIVTVNV